MTKQAWTIYAVDGAGNTWDVETTSNPEYAVVVLDRERKAMRAKGGTAGVFEVDHEESGDAEDRLDDLLDDLAEQAKSDIMAKEHGEMRDAELASSSTYTPNHSRRYLSGTIRGTARAQSTAWNPFLAEERASQAFIDSAKTKPCLRWGSGIDGCIRPFGHLGPCADLEGNTTLTLAAEILGGRK